MLKLLYRGLLHTGIVVATLCCIIQLHGSIFVSDKLPHPRYDQTCVVNITSVIVTYNATKTGQPVS